VDRAKLVARRSAVAGRRRAPGNQGERPQLVFTRATMTSPWMPAPCCAQAVTGVGGGAAATRLGAGRRTMAASRRRLAAKDVGRRFVCSGAEGRKVCVRYRRGIYLRPTKRGANYADRLG
jgi:hypothetical protein